MCLHFYRENNSAFSPLVDSRRSVPTHAARRSQQLILFFFVKSHHAVAIEFKNQSFVVVLEYSIPPDHRGRLRRNKPHWLERGRGCSRSSRTNRQKKSEHERKAQTMTQEAEAEAEEAASKTRSSSSSTKRCSSSSTKRCSRRKLLHRVTQNIFVPCFVPGTV